MTNSFEQHSGYFATGLDRVISCDFSGDRVFAVGVDAARRSHFLVVEGDQLLFRKSLTYEIGKIRAMDGHVVGVGR